MKFEGPDTLAWRTFVATFENAEQLSEEEQRLRWQWFRKGWEARKVAQLNGMYATPHTQRTRPKGAAPHWLRCTYEENGKRCILGEGGHTKHEYEEDTQ